MSTEDDAGGPSKCAGISKLSSRATHLHPSIHHHHHPQLHHPHLRLPHSKRNDAGQRVCKKYRMVRIRKLQQQEYNKLLNIVPTLAAHQEKRRISKVTVIEETIRYIDQLHHALADRIQNETAGKLSLSPKTVANAAKDLFREETLKNQMPVRELSFSSTTVPGNTAPLATSTTTSVSSSCVVCSDKLHSAGSSEQPSA